MDHFDAYAPPRAVVADTEAVQAQVPLAFKILLGIYLGLYVLGSLLSLSGTGVVWGGVLAIAGWKTLGGSRAASRVLGVLLSLTLILALLAAAYILSQGAPDSGPAIAVMLGMAAWMAVLVGFIFFHPGMQAAFRKADAKKWSGG